MPKQQFSDLLAQLQSDEAFARNAAIKKIIKEKINDETIVVALINLIENDPSMSVRNFARSALDVVEKEKELDSSVTILKNTTRASDFAIGFFVWLIVWNFGGPVASVSFFTATILWLIGLVLPFYLHRHWFGLGAVSCVVINAIVISILSNGFSFLNFLIPFFVIAFIMTGQ